MVFVILIIVVIAALYGPFLWVRYVMKKYAAILPGMPGSGSELAQHLIERFELPVALEEGGQGVNHFDPSTNTVCLSPENYNDKSLTAIATAAHEVGHAIQHNRKEKLIMWRTQLAPTIARIEKIGQIVLLAAPFIGLLTRVPQSMFLFILIGVLIMSSRIVFHLLTLPVEWDASFGKALPILKQGNYVPDEYFPAVRKVLKAAAMTYVAAALIDVLNFWRWLRFVR